MTGYQILLLLHILASMLWVGGAATGAMIGSLMRRSGAAALGAFCTAFATVAGPLFGGSALLVLGTGIAMVAQDGGYDFDATFVSIGFAGWFVSLLLGATVVGRSWFKLGLALDAPDADPAMIDPALRTAITWTTIDLVIRVAVVVVMVWKPV